MRENVMSQNLEMKTHAILSLSRFFDAHVLDCIFYA